MPEQDLRYTGLDQFINIPTKSRTNDTLNLISVSIALQKVELTAHWFRLVYRCPSKCRTYDTLVLTTILIVLLLRKPTVCRTKIPQNRLVRFSTRHIGLLIHSVDCKSVELLYVGISIRTRKLSFCSEGIVKVKNSEKILLMILLKLFLLISVKCFIWFYKMSKCHITLPIKQPRDLFVKSICSSKFKIFAFITLGCTRQIGFSVKVPFKNTLQQCNLGKYSKVQF